MYWTPIFHTSIVLPAEPGAAVAAEAVGNHPLGAKADERTGVVHRRRVVVVDPLVVERDQPLVRRAERDADGEVRRDVEAALLREQTLVVVEVPHADLAGVRNADRELIGELAHVADADADAPRVAVAVVGEVGRAGREAAEHLQAFGLEALVGDDRRDADRLALHGLPRHVRRDHQLRQVDAEVAGAAEQVVGRPLALPELPAGALHGNLPARIVGVHPAVAVHGDAEREIRPVFPVDADLGNEEVGAVAVDVAVDVELPRARARRIAAAGENQATPSCHSLPRKLIAPGFTAPPKGSCATATAAPPIPIDFKP